MKNEFLGPTDADAFLGMTKKENHINDGIECPVCHGYGGWHVRLNAYGTGKHFDCCCSQCWGWGYVKANSLDATCIHTSAELSQQDCKKNNIPHFGSCYHVYRCTKCGKIEATDSSG